MDFTHVQTFLSAEWGGNQLQNYIRALIVFLLLYLGFSVIYRLTLRHMDQFARQTKSDVDDLAVALLARLGQPFILVVALYFSTTLLLLPPGVHALIRTFIVIVLTVRVAFLIEEVMRYGIRRMYFHRAKVKADPVTESAINSIIGVLRWIVWGAAFLFLLDNLGVNITTMVASIGITGIAVGMASQAILGDMFSAFAIFLDKPFEVGDFVIIDNYMGTVEQIGIKTTRIRSLFGEQLIFANSDLTRSRIKNFKRLQEPRGSINFTLAYDTPAAKLIQTREIILKTLETVREVRIDHVHLMSVGPAGYNYEAAFYVQKAHVARHFDIQQDVFFRIAENLQKAGITPKS